jgi:hypothetical protein
MQGSVTGETIAQVNDHGLEAVVALVEHLLKQMKTLSRRIML